MSDRVGNEPGKPATRGSRRKEESRRKLLDAARLLFIERGYHDTRPQDIAKQAGVGHGTFYLHFDDKKACFLAFVGEARDEVIQAAIKRIDGITDLEGQVRGIIESTFDYVDENPGVFEAAVTDPGLLAPEENEAPDANILEHWGDVWAEIIKTHQDDGTLPNDFDAVLGGQAVVGITRQTSMVGQRRKMDRKEIAKSMVRLIMRALGGST